ncbi:MAG: thiol:disulfide interchange protein [Flavobacteriaceae bacterium]|nr:MAG: thiol:disulfide interchange protein [Flavobacteriaceae bacterium]
MYFKHIIVIIGLILISGCSGNPKKEMEKSKPVSEYIDVDGNTVSLSGFKGKRVLVNYWATWCIPCIKEMPSLVHAQEILKDEGYIFLFPTTDSLEKIIAFNQKKNYPLQFLHYTSSLDKLKIYALPATFIYNDEGEMVKRIDGATEWDSEEIINLLKAIK